MFMPMYACHVRNTIGANHSNHSTTSFEIISDESLYIFIVKKEKREKNREKQWISLTCFLACLMRAGSTSCHFLRYVNRCVSILDNYSARL